MISAYQNPEVKLPIKELKFKPQLAKEKGQLQQNSKHSDTRRTPDTISKDKIQLNKHKDSVEKNLNQIFFQKQKAEYPIILDEEDQALPISTHRVRKKTDESLIENYNHEGDQTKSGSTKRKIKLKKKGAKENKEKTLDSDDSGRKSHPLRHKHVSPGKEFIYPPTQQFNQNFFNFNQNVKNISKGQIIHDPNGQMVHIIHNEPIIINLETKV